MPGYSNIESLYAEWGKVEVDGILGTPPDTARLEKAIYTAKGEIDSYLASGGYVIPFPFTEYGGTPPTDGSAPLLDGALQGVSDAFSIWHLANRDDFNKKKYDDARAQGIAWLEKIRIGEIRLTLNGVVGPTGSGNVRVISRPRVFDNVMLREPDVFRRY